jgi:single-strand DNA-binding protein
MNTVHVTGNLGQDPILRTTGSAKSVINFTIACDRKQTVTGPDGVARVVKTPDWIPVVVFGVQAENLFKYLQKGSGVLVTGSLRPRTITDRNNIQHSVFDVDATDGSVEFLSNIKSPNVAQQQPAPI